MPRNPVTFRPTAFLGGSSDLRVSRAAARRGVRQLAKSAAAKANIAFEVAGFRLQPLHYYSETPDRRALRRAPEAWATRASLHGIEWDLDDQLRWLQDVTRNYASEVHGLQAYARIAQTGTAGPGYGPIESQVLHCLLRSRRPERIIEIGSGVSTLLAVAAVRRNVQDGHPSTEIISVEPYPSPVLTQQDEIRLISRPCQEVPMKVFDELGEGDVLFIDSTHTVRTGSELPYLYLEILPRLHSGVLVHVHDIYLPYLFSPDILTSLFDWQETTLVTAVLQGNARLKVRACLSALHHDRSAELRQCLPDYLPRPTRSGLFTAAGHGHFPSSLWLETQDT